jgi:Rrf2 family transcriptional regulator, nitric oxide-sensitive transcriptional repressor
MLPKTVEYGLRAVVCLARSPDQRQSADQLAKTTRVPRRYLHKVLQDLVRSGLVCSQSGPGGGYALVASAEVISILDVVNAVGSIERIRRCPLGLQSHNELCPLHRELDKAYAMLESSLAQLTVAQVLEPSASPSPLCEVVADGQSAS